MGEAFAGVEEMIRETFLPHLFFGKTKTLSPIVGALSTMPVKKSGLVLLGSQQEGVELIQAVMGVGAFSNADQLETLGKERRDGKKYWEAAYETKLQDLVRDLKGTNRRLILRAKSTGAWLSVRGTTVSGTVLYAT